MKRCHSASVIFRHERRLTREMSELGTSACVLLLMLILAHISISSQNAVDTTKNRMLNLALRSGLDEFSMVCGEGSCPTANCSVQWLYVGVDSSEEPKNIYNGYEIASEFTLFHVDSDPWHLRSSRLRISDAGKYKCEVSYQKKRLEYSAELIVLASDPQCSIDQGRWNGKEITASVDETIQMHCQVGYRGRWAPVFEWTQVGGAMMTNDSVSREASLTEVRSNFTITVDSSHNGKIFECKPTFTEQNATSTFQASNAPTYNFVWKSPRLAILFSPTNIVVNHVKLIYHPGEMLTCEADGNPEPQFTWHNRAINSAVTGPEFVIEESMIRDEHHSLTCTASNSFGSANVTIQFAVQKGGHFLTNLIWIVTVCALALLLSGTLLYIKYLKESTNNDKQQPVAKPVDPQTTTQTTDEYEEIQFRAETATRTAYSALTAEAASQQESCSEHSESSSPPVFERNTTSDTVRVLYSTSMADYMNVPKQTKVDDFTEECEYQNSVALQDF